MTINRPPADMLGYTSEGEPASCDFCSLQGVACYRYFCNPFEMDGFMNGAGGPTTGEADWAACWVCASVIERVPVIPRRLKTPVMAGVVDQIVQRLVAMAGDRAIRNGKLAPTGARNLTAPVDTAIAMKRIAGFFMHRTGKRVFVGKCDMCGVRGADVRWLYPGEEFDFFDPLSRKKVPVTSDWLACDGCSKLIESNNRKRLTERTIALEQTKEDIWNLTSAERGLFRRSIALFVDAFFEHRKLPRSLIADLPPRVEPPPMAPIAAQVAIEQQMTLLRWITGAGGREYLGGWIDRYSGAAEGPMRPGEERLADGFELEPWTQPLQYGETYYWEPGIAAEMVDYARALRDDPTVEWHLTPDLLPSPQGFFYADVAFGTSAGRPMRALGWTLVADVFSSKTIGTRHRFEVELYQHGRGTPNTAAGVLLSCWSNRPTDTVLRPSGHLLWQFGKDVHTLFNDNINWTDIDPAAAREVEPDPRAEAFASMLAFISQRIVVASRRMGVSSATRKHIAQEAPGRDPSVRIITLRRVAASDYEPPVEPTGRHVSVTFRVRRHWRSQCHQPHQHAAIVAGGGTCIHQGIVVRGHMRGHGPLKHVDTVDLFDVSR